MGKPQQVILNQRHNPNDVVAVIPGVGTRTRLQEVRSVLAKHPVFWGRTDIALVNRYERCHCCGEDTEHNQYTVFATADGSITGNGVQYLNDADTAACMEEAQLIVEAAKIDPEMNVYLKGE